MRDRSSRTTVVVPAAMKRGLYVKAPVSIVEGFVSTGYLFANVAGWLKGERA